MKTATQLLETDLAAAVPRRDGRAIAVFADDGEFEFPYSGLSTFRFPIRTGGFELFFAPVLDGAENVKFRTQNFLWRDENHVSGE